MSGTTRTGNLTAALVAVAVGELVLHRIGSRLFLMRGAADSAPWLRALVETTPPFLVNLTGLLGLIVLVGALVGLMRRRELFPVGMRLSLGIFGLSLVFLVGLGLLAGRLPDEVFVHLHASYGFVGLLTLAGAVPAPMPWRTRAGLVLLAAPGIVHATVLFIDRSSWMSDGALTLLWMSHLGQTLALVAGTLAPVLLPVRSPSPRVLVASLLVGTLAAGLLILAIGADYEVVRAIAQGALRLELPIPPRPSTVIVVLAVFGTTMALVQLLAVAGPSRLLGLGLGALVLAGYQLSAPHEVVLASVGLLAAAVGAVRAHRAVPADGPRFSDEAWRQFAGRLAAAIHAPVAPGAPDAAPVPGPEAVMVHDDDIEVTRLRCQRRGLPVSVRVRRQGGAILDVEILIGDAGRAEPRFSLETEGSRWPRAWPARPGRKRDLGVAQGKASPGAAPAPDFGEHFVVHGGEPGDDDFVRHRLVERAFGVTLVWPGKAVRHRAEPGHGCPVAHPIGADLDPAVTVALVDTLVDTLVHLGPAEAVE